MKKRKSKKQKTQIAYMVINSTVEVTGRYDLTKIHALFSRIFKDY